MRFTSPFPRTIEPQRLIKILEDFGFKEHGTKVNAYGTEAVYVRDMTPKFDVQATGPWKSRQQREIPTTSPHFTAAQIRSTYELRPAIADTLKCTLKCT